MTYNIGGFRNLGDWLISRATGPLGDFVMPKCCSIIVLEGTQDRWRYQVTHDDILRIIARYKEHVSYWNISSTVIQQELMAFATAVNRDYPEVAGLFNSSPARRYPIQA